MVQQNMAVRVYRAGSIRARPGWRAVEILLVAGSDAPRESSHHRWFWLEWGGSAIM